jgi:hypothetical protein
MSSCIHPWSQNVSEHSQSDSTTRHGVLKCFGRSAVQYRRTNLVFGDRERPRALPGFVNDLGGPPGSWQGVGRGAETPDRCDRNGHPPRLGALSPVTAPEQMSCQLNIKPGILITSKPTLHRRPDSFGKLRVNRQGEKLLPRGIGREARERPPKIPRQVTYAESVLRRKRTCSGAKADQRSGAA